MSYNFISNKARSKPPAKTKKVVLSQRVLNGLHGRATWFSMHQSQLKEAYLIFKQMVQEDVLSIDHLNR